MPDGNMELIEPARETMDGRTIDPERETIETGMSPTEMELARDAKPPGNPEVTAECESDTMNETELRFPVEGCEGMETELEREGGSGGGGGNRRPNELGAATEPERPLAAAFVSLAAAVCARVPPAVGLTAIEPMVRVDALRPIRGGGAPEGGTGPERVERRKGGGGGRGGPV